jgi:HSP20 family molecular chaperone IbpA
MTSLTQYDPFFIGFDSVLEKLNSKAFSFPPYNLFKISDSEYEIELAVAGYAKEDITVSLGNGILDISGAVKTQKTKGLIHKGITSRPFSRSFRVAENVEVTSAAYENGILTLSLVNRIPDVKKIKNIVIA